MKWAVALDLAKDAIWMREVRKLTDSGHQTSLISTAFDLPHTQLAARMFSRWCQENFFNYMMQHFDIDVLLEYGVTEFPDTEKVINPTWRQLDRSRNSLQNKLRYRRARFAEMTMHPETEDKPAKYRRLAEEKSRSVRGNRKFRVSAKRVESETERHKQTY